MTRVDKNISREEIEYLFNLFDDDGSNSIEFEEFTKWLEDNNCRMKRTEVRNNAKRLSVLVLPAKKPIGTIEQRTGYILDKLKIAIVRFNINLHELFKKVFL